MKRNVFLSESQIDFLKKTLNEDFDLGQYSNKTSDDKIPGKFDTNLRKIQGLKTGSDSFIDDYNSRFYSDMNMNSVARYIPSSNDNDDDFVINPVTKTLMLGNGESIRCWALGPLTNADYNHAFKEDKVNSTGSQITWEQGVKRQLFSYCADYFTKVIPLACKTEGFNLEDYYGHIYVAWPESSKAFNKTFCTKFLMKSLNKRGIPVKGFISNIVSKSDKLLNINYELAQMLGLDDVDIKALQMFITEQGAIQSTLGARQKIEEILNEIRTELERNDTQEFYQYTTKNKQKEDAINKQNSEWSHTLDDEKNKNTGLYIKDNAKKWKSDNKLTDVNISKGKRVKKENETYEIDEETKKAIKILVQHKDFIIDKYDEIQKKLKGIRDSDAHEIKYNGKTLNFKHFNPKNDQRNTVHDMGAHTTGQFLDNMVGDDGSVSKSKWEIKKLPDVYRNVINGMFQLKDRGDKIWNEISNDKEKKCLILFDDNVSGGSTLSKVCDALLNAPDDLKWDKVLPITISLMKMTQGLTPFQNSKQKEYRDKNSKFGDLSKREKDSIQFWTGDKNGLQNVTLDPSKRRDMGSIFLSQYTGDTEEQYANFTKLDKGKGRVRVFSLNNFVQFCKNNGLNDANVEEKCPNWIFIEIGSTLSRVNLDMGLTIDYDRRKFKNKDAIKNASQDYYNNRRFYFKNNHNNVLRVEFDDNMNIVNGKTSVIYNKDEILKDKNGYNPFYKDKTKGGKASYNGAKGFSSVEEEVFEFIENKIAEFGGNIQFFIHCEQGASRSAALGYYISKRINDDITHYLISHSTFDKNGKFVNTQFRIGKDGEQYKTMHHTIFDRLKEKLKEKYGKNLGNLSITDREIRNFVDNWMYGDERLGNNTTITESELKKIIKETLLKYL
jgi:hypothetical protein